MDKYLASTCPGNMQITLENPEKKSKATDFQEAPPIDKQKNHG